MVPTVIGVAEPAGTVPGGRGEARPGTVGRWAAIVAVEAVIVVHALLTPMHLEETPYIGVLFAVGDALLLVAAVLLAGRRYRGAGWLLAAAVCAGEFVGFILSRTVGLPQGYHEAWAAAPEDYLGLACLPCELFVVVLAAIALRPAVRGRAMA